MFTCTLTSKGQLTLPIEIRRSLNLRAGDQISFKELDSGTFALTSAKKLPITAIKGMFGKSKRSASIEEMNAAVRLKIKRLHQ